MWIPESNNRNCTVSEDHIKTAFKVANCLILSATSLVGVAANVFVILAVYNQKSLQTWNNALVVNLAAIDILRCASDCPVLLTIVLHTHGRGGTHRLICDAQVASFSFCCCVQLLTLACISAERYQAIAQPFKTAERKKRIVFLIPLMWTLATLVAAICLIFVKDSPVHARCKGSAQGEASSYDTFGIYILFPLWAACFGVIIGFYARIFALVRAHNRKIFDKGVFPVVNNEERGHGEPSQHQNKPNSTPTNSPMHVSIRRGNKGGLKAAESGAEPHPPQVPLPQKAVKAQGLKLGVVEAAGAEPSNGDVAASVKSSITKPNKLPGNCGSEKQSCQRMTVDRVPWEVKATSLHVCTSLHSPKAPPSKAPLGLIEGSSVVCGESLVAVEQASLPPTDSNNSPEAARIEGAVCMMPSKANKERANKRKESKMAKRAGYIILTFLLFWLPLITTILINFIVHNNYNTQDATVQEVELLSVSIACITSLSNPITYAAVNPQFSTEFYRLKNKLRSTLVCR